MRIIIGRAGSGKTLRVMREIASRAAAGERMLTLVVPEQYSHEAERQLLQIAGDSLSLHGEVLSFKRLSARVAEELGERRRLIDTGGALLTLYGTLQELSGGLRIYGEQSRRVAFLSALLATVSELRANAVTPEMLRKASLACSGTLSGKLHDLALIADGFEARLNAAGEFDSSSALLHLSETVAGSAYSSGAIWFDGFTDFTQPEMRVIAELAGHGTELTFCFTAPALDDGGEAFRLPCECANDLIMLASDCGIKCEILYHDDISPRPAELLHMQDVLFGEAPDAFEGECKAVEVLCAADAASECATAAALVSELVRNGMRYRDIAVMYHGDTTYSSLCESVFERFGIPVFRSGRENVLDKPPVKLITSALEIITSGWTFESVFTYLKTGLAGIGFERLDELENFCLIRNIRASAWKRDEPWQDAPPDAEEARRAVSQPLLALSDTINNAKTGGDMLRALYAFLEDIALPQTLDRHAEALRAAGRDRLADEYLQMWDLIVGAFEQLYIATRDSKLTLPDFAQMLTLLFSCRDIGVIPVALDRVTIGDMSMNRRRSVKALIALGATDANMPSVPAQTGILSDAELAELSLALGLTDTPERRVYREYSVIYSALTMPSERLYVIYTDNSGTKPSDTVNRLLEAFGLKPKSLAPELLMPPAELETLVLARRGARFERGALSPDVAAELYGGATRLSATRVEAFSRCKYAFFLQSGLRAVPREPERFDAPEQGTFTHFVLERTAAAAKAAGGFRNVRDSEVRELVRRFSAEYIGLNYPDFTERSERFRYLLQRLAKDTENVALDLAGELRLSDFEPHDFEARFVASVPGAGMEVAGVIDRVDSWKRGDTVYLRVADYKTGRPSFSLSDIYYGLGMQMPLYLYALSRESAKYVPAGALYTPARDEVYSAGRDAPDAEIAKALSSKLRRSGIILADPEVIDAMETSEKKLYLPVEKKRGGYDGDSLLTLPQFERLSEFVGEKLKSMADELRGGIIDANPYYKSEHENSCRFCRFDSVCGFGSQRGDSFRRLRPLRGGDFWDALGEGDNNGG